MLKDPNPVSIHIPQDPARESSPKRRSTQTVFPTGHKPGAALARPTLTPQVSLWYTDHSTANPLGVRPDPRVTKVVRGDKFGMEGVEVVKGGQLERWKNRIRKGLRQ